eukprot:COSAG01_NODE_2322_length_7910_cov_16.209960_9_plen_60_part_00
MPWAAVGLMAAVEQDHPQHPPFHRPQAGGTRSALLLITAAGQSMFAFHKSNKNATETYM